MPSWRLPVTQERWIEKEVSDHFKSQIARLDTRSKISKVWQGPMSELGFPDLVLTVEGVTYFLETKRYNEWLTPAQEQYLLAPSDVFRLPGVYTLRLTVSDPVFASP